jgi:hypothetical protein
MLAAGVNTNFESAANTIAKSPKPIGGCATSGSAGNGVEHVVNGRNSGCLDRRSCVNRGNKWWWTKTQDFTAFFVKVLELLWATSLWIHTTS